MPSLVHPLTSGTDRKSTRAERVACGWPQASNFRHDMMVLQANFWLKKALAPWQWLQLQSIADFEM